MALKFTKKVGVATSTMQKVDNKNKVVLAETGENEQVSTGETLVSVEPFCEVGIDVSFTKNLGNFESAKVGVSLRMPSTKEGLDETFEQITAWANGKIEKIVSEL
jgi:hypothetical protein